MKTRSPFLQTKNTDFPSGPVVLQHAGYLPGNVFFVDGGNTNNKSDAAGHGQTPEKPFATIDYAIGQCTASQGDVIYVLPGHTETIAAAAAIDCDVAGISIIGLGSGSDKPTVTAATAAGVDIDIDAANVTIKNIRFIYNVASVTAFIDVNAAGFTLEDCEFMGNDAATETALITIQGVAGADDMVIRNNLFNYLSTLDSTAVTTTSTRCISMVGQDRCVIEGNRIYGDFTVSAIDSLTTACLGISIRNNEIHNIATEDIAGAVDLVAGCNGVIAYNYGSVLYATAISGFIDPSSCSMIENYFSNVVTETGGLVGTAST